MEGCHCDVSHRLDKERYINFQRALSIAIDHRTWNTGLPVRSAVLKPCAGRLVVGWVTTSEYRLLIVFASYNDTTV